MSWDVRCTVMAVLTLVLDDGAKVVPSAGFPHVNHGC